MEGLLVIQMFETPTGPEIYTLAETWSDFDLGWDWVEVFAGYWLYQGDTLVGSDYDMESSSFASVQDVYPAPLGYQYQAYGDHTVLLSAPECPDACGDWWGELYTYVTLDIDALIAVTFNGFKSPGDNLLFSYDPDDCKEILGPIDCPGTQWWLYNAEVHATVNDDASYWTCYQSVTGSTSGNYVDWDGELQPFRFSVNIPNDDPHQTQQPSGQQDIFWLDGPGRRYDYHGHPIDSMTHIRNFTSQVCRTEGIFDCYSVSWYVKIVVNKGGNLDYNNSTANYGSLPLN
jgi:hypothetical protein